MLTIYKPATLQKAAALLKQPGVYPLYGGSTSLLRLGNREIEAAVDLSGLIRTDYQMLGTPVWFTGVTLDSLAEIHGGESGFGAIVRADTPSPLRNMLTLGDVLLECHPDSLLLALLYGLQTELWSPDTDAPSIEEWFNLSPDQRRSSLIECVSLERELSLVNFACEKIVATPSDTPIVGAVGFVPSQHARKHAAEFDPFAVVTGIAPYPTLYVAGVQSQISNDNGNTEYRTEMAKIVSERAIARAFALAEQTSD